MYQSRAESSDKKRGLDMTVKHLLEQKGQNLWTIDPDATVLDALVKMAIVHHQFESIHPFYDGNGRTGRIINILYLIQKKYVQNMILTNCIKCQNVN